jgi:hypothetical protein
MGISLHDLLGGCAFPAASLFDRRTDVAPLRVWAVGALLLCGVKCWYVLCRLLETFVLEVSRVFGSSHRSLLGPPSWRARAGQCTYVDDVVYTGPAGVAGDSAGPPLQGSGSMVGCPWLFPMRPTSNVLFGVSRSAGNVSRVLAGNVKAMARRCVGPGVRVQTGAGGLGFGLDACGLHQRVYSRTCVLLHV